MEILRTLLSLDDDSLFKAVLVLHLQLFSLQVGVLLAVKYKRLSVSNKKKLPNVPTQ